MRTRSRGWPASAGPTDPNGGGTEPGLNASEIGIFMRDNLKRAGSAARWYYPILMKFEWPILLKIMGKGEGEDRYLSVADVRTLFNERKFPDRINQRLVIAAGARRPASSWCAVPLGLRPCRAPRLAGVVALRFPDQIPADAARHPR